MFSISELFPAKAKRMEEEEKLMGKYSEGLRSVCVRFSGFCYA